MMPLDRFHVDLVQKRILAFLWDFLWVAAYLFAVYGLIAGPVALFPTLIRVFLISPVISHLLGFLLITLPIALYFTLREAGPHQGTFGKQKFDLRVETAAGKPPAFAQALGRSLLKLTPWELAHWALWRAFFDGWEITNSGTTGFTLAGGVFFAFVLSLIFDQDGRTIYDRLSGLKVAIFQDEEVI